MHWPFCVQESDSTSDFLFQIVYILKVLNPPFITEELNVSHCVGNELGVKEIIRINLDFYIQVQFYVYIWRQKTVKESALEIQITIQGISLTHKCISIKSNADGSQEGSPASQKTSRTSLDTKRLCPQSSRQRQEYSTLEKAECMPMVGIRGTWGSMSAKITNQPDLVTDPISLSGICREIKPWAFGVGALTPGP